MTNAMDVDNFVSHHARDNKGKREALVDLLQRASSDKRARKFCKAMIRAKLKKSEFGRQLLIGRQLYKKGGQNNNAKIGMSTTENKASVDKYLQHRAARRLAAISFNNVFSLGSDELATKLKSTSYYADTDKATRKEKSCPKSIGMLLTRICAEKEELISSTVSSPSELEIKKLPVSRSIPSLKEAHATMDENNQKLSQISLSNVPIDEKSRRENPVNLPRAA
mmetsp:Transcript_16871/g.24969  ORF Transcript_16871/g.24969 Transcript_16871/m.24969 type:complete len:223 (+) Transcript_16871:163-831(+)